MRVMYKYGDGEPRFVTYETVEKANASIQVLAENIPAHDTCEWTMYGDDGETVASGVMGTSTPLPPPVQGPGSVL